MAFSVDIFLSILAIFTRFSNCHPQFPQFPQLAATPVFIRVCGKLDVFFLHMLCYNFTYPKKTAQTDSVSRQIRTGNESRRDYEYNFFDR